MIAALLHAGRPLALEELAARLSSAGARTGSGDLETSLPRAWRGRRPVWKDRAGRFGLDPDDFETRRFLLRNGLAPDSRAALARLEPEPRSESDPLTDEEVTHALRGRSTSGMSNPRLAGAILDAAGRPLPLATVEERLRELIGHRLRLAADSFRRKPVGPVSVDEDGVLHLDPDHPSVPGMRREIRARARPALKRALVDRHLDTVVEPARSRQRRRRRKEARARRRAVLRALPVGDPVLLGRLDVATREIRVLPSTSREEIVDDLAGYDVLVGLDVRGLLEDFPVDPAAFRLRDLSPPRKTWRLNRAGRTLRLTPALLITSSVGISRPLADPAVVSRYVTAGHTGRLRRRLGSDLRSLHAFYRYGLLHGMVRLRWGFLDEVLPVDWAEEGDPSLPSMLLMVNELGAVLEVVTGHAPSLTDPWSRARRIRVTRKGLGRTVVQDARTGDRISLADVQAARVAPDEES